jgi:hypothetical protein
MASRIGRDLLASADDPAEVLIPTVVPSTLDLPGQHLGREADCTAPGGRVE